MYEFLMPPKRRDVAGLKSQLGALAPWDQVSALLKSSRYGDYRVEGYAHESLHGDLVVAGHVLGGPLGSENRKGEDVMIRKPDNELVGLGGADEAADHEQSDAAESGGYEEHEGRALESLAHGDLVRGWFEQKPYGRFAVTGVCTFADDDSDTAMVGEWLLKSGGAAAQRLRDLEILAPAGTHEIPVPERRAALQIDSLG